MMVSGAKHVLVKRKRVSAPKRRPCTVAKSIRCRSVAYDTMYLPTLRIRYHHAFCSFTFRHPTTMHPPPCVILASFETLSKCFFRVPWPILTHNVLISIAYELLCQCKRNLYLCLTIEPRNIGRINNARSSRSLSRTMRPSRDDYVAHLSTFLLLHHCSAD